MGRHVLDLNRRATQKLVNALVDTHLDAGIITAGEAENVYQYYMKHPELLMAIMQEPMRMELLGFTNTEDAKRLCLRVLSEYVCPEPSTSSIPHLKRYQFTKVHSLGMVA